MPDTIAFSSRVLTRRSNGKLPTTFVNRLLKRSVSVSSTSSDETLITSKPPSVLNPLIVCGPSGVGKGTIIQKFMEEFGGSEHFGFTVSHTTRNARPGEENGVHYHFVTKDVMERDIEMGRFIEHAEVHGNFYGTSIDSMSFVQSIGKICLLDIDVQGVKNIKRYQSKCIQTTATSSPIQPTLSNGAPLLQPKYIFIAPPSMDELKGRLKERGTETEESLRRRTENASREMDYGMQLGNFDAIVVNQDLDLACEEFYATVRKFYDEFISIEMVE